MRTISYLFACAIGGAIVGIAFGRFARASFHYPLRPDAASPAHQAVLSALDVVEWPTLFALTLGLALALWVWSRPPRGGPSPSRRVAMSLVGFLGTIAALLVFPQTNDPGATLAAVVAALMGALVAALLLTLWREATRGTGSIRDRWLRQLPIGTGHLLSTTTASLSLGYRGESALIHGIALLIGLGLFVAEMTAAIAIAGLARHWGSSDDGGPRA